MSSLICARCGTPVGGGARFCPSCGQSLPAFRPGQLVEDKYEVLELLAEGGMGEVYRVRHLHLDEVRIVKTMRAGLLADEAQQRRFQHEARLATRVRHGNVATLHDFSRLADGTFYMVWEYLDGRTIQQWTLAEGRLRPLDAIDVTLQVLDGLGAIHAAGVVHRDISPDNVMLVGAGSSAADAAAIGGVTGIQAKIIDLGIAKSLAAGDGDGAGRTETGMFVGKVKYASPEQAGLLDEGSRLDARSDLYSLGVTLYEMLAGTVPFKSSTPEGYLVKHIHEVPPPLAHFAPELAIPASLEEVVARALEKDRDRRFASAADFHAALAHARGDLTAGRARQGQATVAMYPGPTAPAARQPVDPHAPTLLQITAAGGQEIPPRRSGVASWGPWALGFMLLAGAAGFMLMRGGGSAPGAAPASSSLAPPAAAAPATPTLPTSPPAPPEPAWEYDIVGESLAASPAPASATPGPSAAPVLAATAATAAATAAASPATAAPAPSDADLTAVRNTLRQIERESAQRPLSAAELASMLAPIIELWKNYPAHPLTAASMREVGDHTAAELRRALADRDRRRSLEYRQLYQSLPAGARSSSFPERAGEPQPVARSEDAPAPGSRPPAGSLTARLLPPRQPGGLPSFSVSATETELAAVTVFARERGTAQWRPIVLDRQSNGSFSAPLSARPSPLVALEYYIVARSTDGSEINEGSAAAPRALGGGSRRRRER